MTDPDLAGFGSPGAGAEELATLLSVAVQIEPELIRAVRLACAPTWDVGAEADLWFSDWVASRSAESIRLRDELLPTLRDRLRERLATNPHDPAWKVWHTVAKVHAGLPPALALEEQLTWSVIVQLAGAIPPPGGIDDLLMPALRAVILDQRMGVADWFSAAWHRLPDAVHRSSTAWQLLQLSSQATAAFPEVELTVGDVFALKDLVPDIVLPVRHDGARLVLNDRTADVGVPVPDTYPRIVEVRWGDYRQVLRVAADAESTIQVGAGPVQLLTGRGELFQVDAPLSAGPVSGEASLINQTNTRPRWPRRHFIGAATVAYGPGTNLPDEPKFAVELNRARNLFVKLGYEVIPGFGVGLTVAEIETRLRAFLLSPDRSADDVIVVYYAGHGIVRENDVLLPMADTTDDLDSTSLRASTLTGRLLQGMDLSDGVVDKQILVVLDNCYSGDYPGGLAGELNHLQTLRATPGIALIAGAHAYQPMATVSLTSALTEAIEQDRAVAGHDLPFLPLESLIDAVNARITDHQHVEVVFAGEQANAFFPNPRYDRWFTDFDLRTRDLLQQRRNRQTDRAVHVLPHARGLDAPGMSDLWLFTGRHEALRQINHWLAAAKSPTLVVTGSPGSGKSSVLARIDVLADPKRRAQVPNLHLLPADTIPALGSISRFIHARGMTPQQMLAAMVEACDLEVADVTSVGDLLSQVKNRPDPLVVIIDAVDETVGDDATRARFPIVDQVLGPLMRGLQATPLRLLIGTRRHLLNDLARDSSVIDLDAQHFADPASVVLYARRCLTELIDISPYRSKPAAYLDAVAEAVGEAASGSYLVALITARSLALQSNLVEDPFDPQWRAALPRQAAEAMRSDLDYRLGIDAARARDLLLPLAYAQLEGLLWEDLWPPLVTRMTGRPCTSADLDWLIEYAGYYITESSAGGHTVYRLYHEALAEHLRAGRDAEADRAAFDQFISYRAEVRRTGQARSPASRQFVGGARVVAVHGMLSTFAGRAQMAAEWGRALLDGLELAAGRNDLLSAEEISYVYYGDVFRPPGQHLDSPPPLTADDIDDGLELDLVMAWQEALPVVDPEATAKIAQPRGIRSSVRAILLALTTSRWFAQVSERALVWQIKQISMYFTDPAIRLEAQARFAASIGPDTRVVVAHALGSVVAYEALCAHPEWGVTDFVTLGSPLGIPHIVLHRLQPPPAIRNGTVVGAWPGVERWVNISDDGDFVALQPRLRTVFGERVTDLRVRNGTSVHAATRYLSTATTGAAILTGLR